MQINIGVVTNDMDHNSQLPVSDLSGSLMFDLYLMVQVQIPEVTGAFYSIRLLWKRSGIWSQYLQLCVQDGLGHIHGHDFFSSCSEAPFYL